MPTFRFDKLVRDKVPEIMESEGLGVSSHVAQGEETYRRLLARMREELKEFERLPSIDEACDFWEANDAFTRIYGVSNSSTHEEANDMFDKLSDACHAQGFDTDTIERAQIVKRVLVGGFMGMIIVDTVMVPAEDTKNIERFTEKGYELVG